MKKTCLRVFLLWCFFLSFSSLPLVSILIYITNLQKSLCSATATAAHSEFSNTTKNKKMFSICHAFAQFTAVIQWENKELENSECECFHFMLLVTVLSATLHLINVIGCVPKHAPTEWKSWQFLLLFQVANSFNYHNIFLQNVFFIYLFFSSPFISPFFFIFFSFPLSSENGKTKAKIK